MVLQEELFGIPAVGIASKSMARDYKSSLKAFGLPEMPVVIVPHEFTSTEDKEVEKEIEDAIEDIISALTKPLVTGEGSILGAITTPTPPEGYPVAPPILEEVIRISAPSYDETYDLFNKRFLDWGWSDGFPLIPPTKEKVAEMLKGTSHSPEEIVIRKFEPANGIATVKKIAINAVMAGCKPEYLPVLLTAVELMSDPKFELRNAAMSTGSHAPFFWVNGPIIKELGINYGRCCLGPGGELGQDSRANIAIGRAIRLIMMNIGGTYCGIKDMDTLGTARKFGMVVAENEEVVTKLGWKPYHVEIGYDPKKSVLSGMDTAAETEVADLFNVDPYKLLKTYGISLVNKAGDSFRSCPAEKMDCHALVLLVPAHAELIAKKGWTKDEMKEAIFAEARFPKRELQLRIGENLEGGFMGMYPKWYYGADPDAMFSDFKAPDRIKIIVVGGPAGKGQTFESGRKSVSVEIDKWR